MTIFYGDKISQAGLSSDLSRVEKVGGENLVPVRGVLVVVGVEHLTCTGSVRLSSSLRGGYLVLIVLTDAVYEDQTEIENVEDSEGYEELVESVSQLFS